MMPDLLKFDEHRIPGSLKKKLTILLFNIARYRLHMYYAENMNTKTLLKKQKTITKTRYLGAQLENC